MATAHINPRCHYSGKAYPVPLADSSERWLKVYRNCKAEAAYQHAKRTVDLAIDYGIIEPEKICDRRADPLQLNHKTANVGFAHVFRDTPHNRERFPADDFSRHPLVIEGFETFDRLRNNDLSGQDRGLYRKLLEKPSLGTLIRLPDLMQYHGKCGPASEKELARLDPSTFYFFQNQTGRTEYQRVAQAAHNIYGPLAEFFGYTKRLAGDLDMMSYYNLNPSLYEKVMVCLRLIRPRVKATNRIMKSVVSQLEDTLKSSGYECDIRMRDHKHEGRVMRKVDRKLREGGGAIYDHVAQLSDLAAFTVVLHSCRDIPIADGDERHFSYVAHAVMLVTVALLGEGGMEATPRNYITHPKRNGYRSLHVDMVFKNPELLGMEAIIRNTQMDRIATEGGAAHYLYKGAGPEIQAIQRAYQNVKEAILKGLNGA